MAKKNETKIEELEAALASTRAEYNAGYNTLPRPELEALSGKCKALAAELAESIVDGAAPCPSCGATPHGMRQNFTVGKEVVQGFEIGCTSCMDHHALGFDRENAVAKWNGGPRRWMSPKDGRARAANGKGEIETILRDGTVINWTERARSRQRSAAEQAAS